MTLAAVVGLIHHRSVNALWIVHFAVTAHRQIVGRSFPLSFRVLALSKTQNEDSVDPKTSNIKLSTAALRS